MGIFITFEGCDGAGKTTQAALLAERLAESHSVKTLREPGGTELGDFIYSYVSHQRNQSANQTFFPELGSPGFPGKVEPIAELFLFAAARTQLVNEVLRPALAAGEVVICDRFADSTTAYQGYGRELPLEQVNKMNEVATGGLKPHLTILLDIDADAGLSRVPEKKDRMEKQARDFHRRVREGYLEIAKEDPDRFLKLDAKLPAEELQVRIWRRVEQLLSTNSSPVEIAQRLL